MELEAVRDEAEVFVIAGGGTGRHVYRRLQRQGTAFVTGILFENDLDYPVARALAADVIAAESFEPIGEILLAEAKEKMDSCKSVICTKSVFGSLEKANEELFAYAKAEGKLLDEWEEITFSNDTVPSSL